MIILSHLNCKEESREAVVGALPGFFAASEKTDRRQHYRESKSIFFFLTCNQSVTNDRGLAFGSR